MAVKRNYQPVTAALTSANTAKSNIPIVTQSLTTSKWGLLLIAGLAQTSDSEIISNGTVVIWANTATAGSLTSADYMTFTNNDGRYGITIPTTNKYAVKIYS